jgi:uncharacterized protein RhaS with RHS repeats
MQQRYYDPIAGRFLSMDPISTNADTGAKFDRYMYANNNPYRFTDPDGRDEKDDLPPQAEDCGCRRVTLPPVTISGTKAVEAATPGMLATMLRVSRLTNSLVLQAVNGNRPKNPPNVGPPGGWIQGPRRGRLYGPDGRPVLDIDEPHQGNEVPHAHEWPDGQREEPGRPVSPWSPDSNDVE